MLRILPEDLRKDLHAEVFANVLLAHPLFSELNSWDPDGLEHVTHVAMTDNFFALGTQLWHVDTVATKTLFVLRGELHLFSLHADSNRWMHVQKPEPHAVAHDILCEQALWLNTTHTGDLYSITDVEVFELDSHTFAEVMQRGPLTVFLSFYAKRYQQLIHRCGQPLTSEPETAAVLVEE